ncbi:hypothetical protein J8273_7581 [Carpediemonas membranifera]|uniref:Coiled-coil domain-containing protein 86 n=1 Tax=Carpediemonas membranifera TaxID=201153 RepID=A0A8J6ASN0_9EUKA|nr:hypothetical protein J8273_7581 [Carpediemonas membranifera]|eukprot:KAG9391340.1 hypothetical protein J8273_7581 [Carpediemonas membranifera]
MAGEVSGRGWKQERSRKSSMTNNKSTTWEEKMAEKERLMKAKALANELKAIQDAEKEKKREARAQKLKKREESMIARGELVKKNVKNKKVKLSIAKRRRMKQYAKAINSVEWSK